MPYSVSQGGGTCGSSEWAVLKDSDGSTMGCHASKDDAQAQLAALYANELDASASRGIPAPQLPSGRMMAMRTTTTNPATGTQRHAAVPHTPTGRHRPIPG